VARPGRLELPTLCLEGRRSIQLSYGRVDTTASVYGAYLIFDNRQLRHGILIVPNFVPT
jgi:hypothetical protein